MGNNKKRELLWLTGYPIRRSEGIKCGVYRCQNTDVREFKFGFFCEKCFMRAQECCEPDCHNPIQFDRRYCIKRCRLCEFDYEPTREVYNESPIAEMQIWAPQYKHGSMDLKSYLDRAIKKHGIKTPNQKEGLFYK